MATRTCSSCHKGLPKSSYSKNQWSKNPYVAKCKNCVAGVGEGGGGSAAQGATTNAPEVEAALLPPSTDTAAATTMPDVADEAAAATAQVEALLASSDAEDDQNSEQGSDDSSDDSFESFESAQESQLHVDEPSITSYIGAIDTTAEDIVVSPTKKKEEGAAGEGKNNDEREDNKASKRNNKHSSSSFFGDKEGDPFRPSAFAISEVKDEAALSAVTATAAGGQQQLLSPASERYYSATTGLSTASGLASSISEIKEEEEETKSVGALSDSGMISVDIPFMDDPQDLTSQQRTNDPSGTSSPGAGPPTPVASDLTQILDQAVSGLNEFSETLSADEDMVPFRASIESTTSSNFGGDVRDLTKAAMPNSGFDTSSHNSDAAGDKVDGGSIDDYADEATSLPSYSFAPKIQEKSARILRSYKPSASRFRGASLLAWRRGRPPASSSVDGDNNNNNNNNNNSFSSGGLSGFASISEEGFKKIEGTEVTDESVNDEEGGASSRPSSSISIGNLLKDTYSFIYIYPACSSLLLPSAPFTYAILLFLFQSLVYALLLSSLIDLENTNNVLRVATNVGLTMRVAQGCAIFIAVFNGVDIMVALNNLLRPPDAIVVIDGNGTNNNGSESQGFLTDSSINNNNNTNNNNAIMHSPSALSSNQRGMAFSSSSTTNINNNVSSGLGQRVSFPAGMRFKFANVLRLIEGCLAVATSFILIVQAHDVIQLFMNFAALEFVVNLDNLAFALAEHGLISDKLQDAARFVGSLGFAYRDNRDHGSGYENHRTKKKQGRGSCTDSSRRLAQLKGSYISSLFGIFGSPVRCMKSHPDGTRRTTLAFMTLTLFGCWAWILLGLEEGVGGAYDSLSKSLHVEFFHAHVPASTAQEAEDGIKPFLASRSGTYIASFLEMEDEDEDELEPSFWDKVTNAVTGGKEETKKMFLAYKKVDPKVEPSAEVTLMAEARLPANYEEVVFYNPETKRWVFTTCDPDTDLRDVGRACAGPQVLSVETDSTDFTELSSSSFVIVDEKGSQVSSIPLPATVTSNECRSSEYEGSDPDMCGLSGGTCSTPRADLGYAQQCECPPGQYGIHCQDHYGTSCPSLEIVLLEGVDEPPGALQFERWEVQRAFTLQTSLRGSGNSPVWERHFGSKGYTDFLEWRGGEYWVITRRQNALKTSHTLAIAEGDGSVTTATSGGVGVGGGGGVVPGVQQQPPPAGLTFHAPKTAAWGTQPDFYRPYASYEFRCKAAPMDIIP